MAEYGYYVVPPEGGRYGQAYILINDVYVDQFLNETRIKTRSKKSNKDCSQYLKGTLLREVEVDATLEEDRILCKNPESEIYFQCYRRDLKEISENVFDLLLAISNCKDRLEVSQDPSRLAEGLEMDVGHEVSVNIPNYSGEMRGIVRYKGIVNGKDGIQFGIELFNTDGRGNCNGTYGKARYFQCDTDAGIFLPLNRVRPARNRNQSPITSSRRGKQSRLTNGASNRTRSNMETCPPTHGITKDELANLGIAHGTEVYIFTEVRGRESQEKGRVKFIGRLPGNSSGQVYVGIDLDRDVGNGTGLYGGKHLFYTRPNHAALVPLSGVLPAYVAKVPSSERLGASSNTPSATAAKKSHRMHNSSPSHILPAHRQKTFVQSYSRTSHSSPDVLGGRSGQVEEYPVRVFERSSHRSVRPHHGTSVDLYNTDNIRDENASFCSKNQKIDVRRPLQSPDSEDNSGDEMDLYGSDNSVAISKPTERKDFLYDNVQSSNPNTRHLYQARSSSSMPGIPPVPMAERAGRDVRTVPGYGRDVLPAEIVDLNMITDKISNRLNPADIDEMEVGTMVEVSGETLGQDAEDGPTYGVIKWIGRLPNNEKDPAAGVELERPISKGTDGTFSGVRYFTCDYGRGLFVFLKFCKRDPRFHMPVQGAVANMEMAVTRKDFGDFNSPIIPGAVPPPRKLDDAMVGKKRGIQGHHNSCYLDSTLFSLFAYSQVLDTILFRPRRSDDLPEYEETQKVLKECIVNPLRKHHFVRADRIMLLRKLLDKLGSTTGLVNEEKDPEEFLNTLLHQVFKAEPLHELRQGNSMAAHEGFFYQIFMERDEKFFCPTTQQLLEKSLISADLKFRNVPVCLILQMPRFGKDYKMYKKLKPSLQLDVTNLVEDMPRSCDVCESYAECECRDCFLEGSMNEHSLSYCKECAQRMHLHRKRRHHNCREIKLPDEFREYADGMINKDEQPIIQRQILELFAVVCIATSHYVSFAKCGTGKNASWVFFDSMADRIGELNGYNIPEVTACPQVGEWLEESERSIQQEDEKLMPELKRRLLCDSYMCMYQSRELMFNK